MAVLSDVSSDDEEMNQAVLAGLQSERLVQNANVLW